MNSQKIQYEDKHNVLYADKYPWYLIDLDVKGQGQINLMCVDVLYSYHIIIGIQGSY